MKLPGIQETLADRIIEARPFTSASELKKIKRIKEGRVSAIADLVEP